MSVTSQLNDLPRDDDIIKSIEQPFDKVQRREPTKLLSALIPIEKVNDDWLINYSPSYILHETCECVNQLQKLIKLCDPSQEQVRIKLVIYCHIMESDYSYTVLWNLLRVLSGLPCQWTFTMLTDKNKIKTCEYP